MSSPEFRLHVRPGAPSVGASVLLAHAAVVAGAWATCPACGVVEPYRFDPAVAGFEQEGDRCRCGERTLPGRPRNVALHLALEPVGRPVHVPTVANWLATSALVSTGVRTPAPDELVVEVPVRRDFAPDATITTHVDHVTLVRALVRVTAP